MSIAVAIKKVRRNLSDYGFGETLRKGMSHLLQAVYVRRTYRIYRRDLRTVQWQDLAPEGITFTVVDAGDTAVIRQIEGMEEWLQGQLPGRLSQGMCIAALDGASVAGFNLVAFREIAIPLLNMRKRLRPGQAWSEQISVRKDYRKQGLASALRFRVFSELHRRSFRALYGGALLSNIASLKTAQKVGFRFIADARYLKVLNRECRRYRRIAHGAH